MVFVICMMGFSVCFFAGQVCILAGFVSTWHVRGRAHVYVESRMQDVTMVFCGGRRLFACIEGLVVRVHALFVARHANTD